MANEDSPAVHVLEGFFSLVPGAKYASGLAFLKARISTILGCGICSCTEPCSGRWFNPQQQFILPPFTDTENSNIRRRPRCQHRVAILQKQPSSTTPGGHGTHRFDRPIGGEDLFQTLG